MGMGVTELLCGTGVPLDRNECESYVKVSKGLWYARYGERSEIFLTSLCMVRAGVQLGDVVLGIEPPVRSQVPLIHQMNCHLIQDLLETHQSTG